MKKSITKTILIIIIFYIAILLLYTQTLADICVTPYQSPSGFSVDLPAWDRSEMMRQNALEFICAHSQHIYIKVIKLKNPPDDILHYMSWKIWDTDPNAHFVIKDKLEDGGIIISTYRNKTYSLHRVRMIQQKEYTYIIECSAPEKSFYNYEKYFNRVFKSFTLQ